MTVPKKWTLVSSILECSARDLHNWFRSGFWDFRGCVWRGYGRHRGSCVMPLAWVGHEIWYKNKNRTLFRKNFFFDENFIFEEIWKSKILQKKVIFRRKNITFFHWFFIEKSDFFEEKFQIFFRDFFRDLFFHDHIIQKSSKCNWELEKIQENITEKTRLKNICPGKS